MGPGPFASAGAIVAVLAACGVDLDLAVARSYQLLVDYGGCNALYLCEFDGSKCAGCSATAQ